MTGVAQPPGPCAVFGCGAPFEPGDYWWYHWRVRIYTHEKCEVDGLNEPEVSLARKTVFRGRVPLMEEMEDE